MSTDNLDPLKTAKDLFHAELVTNNNQGDADAGVALLLDALLSDNPAKAIKQHKDLKKPQLLASLGFLNGLNLGQAKEQFNGLKVDQLSEQIILKYNMLCPDICLHCSKVYKAFNMSPQSAFSSHILPVYRYDFPLSMSFTAVRT